MIYDCRAMNTHEHSMSTPKTEVGGFELRQLEDHHDSKPYAIVWPRFSYLFIKQKFYSISSSSFGRMRPYALYLSMSSVQESLDGRIGEIISAIS